jgi:hypothetical protein
MGHTANAEGIKRSHYDNPYGMRQRFSYLDSTEGTAIKLSLYTMQKLNFVQSAWEVCDAQIEFRGKTYNNEFEMPFDVRQA